MDVLKKVIFSTLLTALIIICSGGMTSCSKSYPCPGNGQMSAADLSLFDEDGNPIGNSKKKKKGNGLVNKKSPKKIRRKTNLKLE